MVFLHNDFYTASGSVKLYNCWTDKVTKHDTSSFYNWEEDNLPIYDLEERTYYLWEKLGHPTSSLPGVVLVVSAGGSESDYACNRNIFQSLEDAVDALPEVLNYPVIIEVCNKGQLGTLNLKNIKCNKLGSLEIVNKVFAKAEPRLGTSSIHNISVETNYQLLNGLSAFPNLFSLRQHFADTKSEFLGKKIFSSINDLSSASFNLNGFASLAENGYYNRPTYFANSNFEIGGFNQIPGYFGFEYMEATIAGLNDQVGIKDFSATEEVTSSLLYNNDLSADDFGDVFIIDQKPVVGLFYANQIERIKVSNCDGPIYIRNFFIDGSGYNFSSNYYGVEINNSENVYLENCISIRNNKAGFCFNDSKVFLTRGIGAYRNYNRPRVFLSSINYDLDQGAGLLANNSEIYFSSTRAFEEKLAKNDPVYSGTLTGLSSLDYENNYPLSFSRNANGIILNNSKFHGGMAGSSYTQLTTDVNTFVGIKLNNSQFDWNGRIISLGNRTGLLSNNSLIKTDKHTFKHNQDYGINLIDSTLIYNKNLSGTGLQFFFDRNGIHLNLKNSDYTCDIVSNMPNLIGTHKFYDSHKKTDLGTPANSLPSIIVQDSSKCVLLHPYINRSASSVIADLNPQTNFTPKVGLIASINKNSKAIFKGSAEAATILFGPATVNTQINSVGVFVSDDSSFDIHGPTAIAQLGIDILTQNNSVLNIKPHVDDNGNLQIKQFNLSSPANHTMVELHSTRSCLVADKNSTINLKNLGSFWQSWQASVLGQNALSSTPDQTLQALSIFTSGGSLQFYPNPIRLTAGNNFALTNTEDPEVSNKFLATREYIFPRTTSPSNNFSSITYGGMCVRALNNSIVNVQNVHFPCGWWNPSGPIYDAGDIGNVLITPNLCNKLFIWNIADNSQINASYCSVDDNFPLTAGYHGPYGIWLSSFENGSNLRGTPLSGLPNSTPDTSSLSILDYFGSGPVSGQGSSVFFTSSFQNQGAFRLFFSVDPACNLLNLISSVTPFATGDYYLPGWLYQIYSQGYQAPFSASAVSSASTIHKSLLKGNSTTATLTGYYYGSSMLHAPNTVRAFLDESAASVFANAKHCSVGKSGMGKVASIHYPYLGVSGTESSDVKGLGFGLYAVNFFEIDRNS